MVWKIYEEAVVEKQLRELITGRILERNMIEAKY